MLACDLSEDHNTAFASGVVLVLMVVLVLAVVEVTAVVVDVVVVVEGDAGGVKFGWLSLTGDGIAASAAGAVEGWRAKRSR